MRILKLFLSLDHNMKCLLFEAYFSLAWARVLKALPFSKITPFLGEQMKETKEQIGSQEMKVIRRVSQAIGIMSDYTFWESKCLVRAIAGMKMLEKRNIDCTLYLGTAKENGSMSAHAWLRSGPYYVTGADVMKRYSVVAKFAKEIK
ncbi:lasso peptide biosynthesis B2 protein [Bacillus sp. AK128]